MSSPLTSPKHFHVWEYRNRWREWKCQKCAAALRNDVMSTLSGGPWEAMEMTLEELDTLTRRHDVAQAMGRLNFG